MDSLNARYGIMASGKATRISARRCAVGVTPEVAAKIGAVYKIGTFWPLEPGVRQFAVGLEEIFIIEERREIVRISEAGAVQLARRCAAAHHRQDGRPTALLPFAEELSVASLAGLAHRAAASPQPQPRNRRDARRGRRFNGRGEPDAAVAPITRTPYFCSGCPHNTSTKVLEGARPSPVSVATSWRCGWTAD
jgi:indolepyruvate ferredoxin oxidoreductase